MATYDYEAQKASLDRRRKMAEALQLQSMQPIQGNNLHWSSGLAQIVGALAGQKQQKAVGAEEQELAGRYKQDLVKGVENYMNTSQGQAAPQAQLIDPFSGTSRMETIGTATPGDPKKAMLEALASNHPVLQQLGMSQLSGLGKKETLSKKDLLSLGDFDAKSRIAAAMAGDESLLAPAIKEHVVGNQIVAGIPGGDGGYKSVGDFRERFSPVGQIATGPEGKPIIGQMEQTTGKASFAPAGTSVNVDTGAKGAQAFSKSIGEKRADLLTKSYEKAQTASESLQSLNAAAEDFAAGIKSGAPAQIALGLAKWGKALGIEADPSIANTEAFRANMAQQVLATVKALGSGTGISNADRDYAADAAGGRITLDDQAMYRLMNIARAGAANSLISHHALLERNMNASGAVPEDLETFRVPFSIPVGDDLDWSPSTGKVVVKSRGPAAAKPGTPSNAPIPGQASPAASGGVVEWADYLKSKGVR